MNPEQIISLRPTERTLASVADSQKKIAEALAKAVAHRDALLASRHGIIAKGTANQIISVRKEIEDAENSIVELHELNMAVESQIEPIKREIAEIEDARLFKIADDAAKKWIDWFSSRYEVLAREMAEGLAMERDAIVAASQLGLKRIGEDSDCRARMKNSERYEPVVRPAPEKYNRLYTDVPNRRFFKVIQLPSVGGATHKNAFWWDPE